MILAATVAIGLVAGGLGRFGYTLILPSIRDDLQLSYTQSGFLVTSNFLGYLGAAVFGGLLGARLGVRGATVLGLILMLAGMGGSALAPAYAVLLLLQFPIGFGTGTVMIASISTLPAWFPARLRGLVAGLGNGAAGLGIVLSGFLVPILLGGFGPTGWRQIWWAFAGCVGAALVIGAVFLKRRPVAAGPARTAGPRRPLSTIYRTPLYWRLMPAILLMGAAQSVYGTYFGAYGSRELRIDPGLVGLIWSGVGLLSVLSGILWGLISDRAGRKRAFAAALGVQSLASLLLVLAAGGGAITLGISGAIAGLTLFGAATVMTAVLVDISEPEALPAVGGMMAVGNGIGQLAGPALAGSVTDLTGSLIAAYIFAALASAGGILAATLFPPLVRPGETARAAGAGARPAAAEAPTPAIASAGVGGRSGSIGC
ncbi:MAG TPA: MFS transporter [Dehalococcoidia bacterium]|nr:MFS transporter [Dehalococcoidia bacterium]